MISKYSNARKHFNNKIKILSRIQIKINISLDQKWNRNAHW
jgi:hypothetical protein